jgi:hypothetical protein
MCNIALRFSEKFTSKHINELCETGEKGSGIFVVDSDMSSHIIRNMSQKELKQEYYSLPPNPLFSLYHSRWPSRGEAAIENVQPFFDEKTGIVLCHNGTITQTDYFVYELLKMDDCDFLYNSPSDSLILFHILTHLYSVESSKKVLSLLVYLKDNFAFIDTKNRLIYLIGHFVKRKEYIEKSYQADRVYTVLDYTGKIIAGDELVEKEKDSCLTYNGYTYYRNGVWYRRKDGNGNDKKEDKSYFDNTD